MLLSLLWYYNKPSTIEKLQCRILWSNFLRCTKKNSSSLMSVKALSKYFQWESKLKTSNCIWENIVHIAKSDTCECYKQNIWKITFISTILVHAFLHWIWPCCLCLTYGFENLFILFKLQRFNSRGFNLLWEGLIVWW